MYNIIIIIIRNNQENDTYQPKQIMPVNYNKKFTREQLLQIIRKHNKDTTTSYLKIRNYNNQTKSHLVKICEVIDEGDDKIKDWNDYAKFVEDGDVVLTVTKNRKSINDTIEPGPKNNPLEMKELENEFVKISLNRHSLLFVDKAPTKQVMLGNVNRKETELCEICCVVKKSQQMMPCYNCPYPCCSECFLKRAYMTLKKGNLDGRCFACRAELVVAKK